MGSAQSNESRRRGIGLCLSGGGFRGTLFHTGVIQRLFELGIATRPDFDTVASVSGGSIAAAQWACAEARARDEGRAVDFKRDVLQPILALTGRDIRTGTMARKYLLPWNWFRGGYAVESMVAQFEEAFGKGIVCLTSSPKIYGSSRTACRVCPSVTTASATPLAWSFHFRPREI